ncbi:potassium transporter 19-like [Cynara cardunculus var. scolymus]|uniref:potassium transporter 19-like n=1 Tax=Cynara cardunculus var. scolymus TaxID=59895 RepID=UPI000D631107|nr:potassium transporter 19-like [Cynara cardunculus var. scolymus]
MSTPGGSKRNSNMSTPGGSKRNSNVVNIYEEDDNQNHNQIYSHQTPDPLLPEIEPPGLKRHDSLDIESAKIHGHHGHHGTKDWGIILRLAFQSIGVVYGDIGTSPLYVYASTFTDGIKHEDDILGVLSLIFYTITLIPVIKYVMIVLHANDNGDGGTFALYSKLCRFAKVGVIPSEQAEDREVSNFQLELPSKVNTISSKFKKALENSKFAKFCLLFAAMLGTSMVIGDGILTPSISVLSAVSGLKEATDTMTEGRIVIVSVIILITLFMVQRFGTDKVGYSFAPIICVWFALIGGIGVFNFIKFDPSVAKAINPKYIVDYFRRNKKDAWISLGGVVLAITGTEAMFADLGHFTVKSIQISMGCVVYPALITAYSGQASWLRKHQDDVADTFYKSAPDALYWPVFVVAVMAAIIASQAMISGTFSIIKQSLSLGCFPRVTVVHTSEKYEGQVFIPEMNYLLMIGCVIVTVTFRTTENIGHAYGIAVIFAETLTSSFMVVIMLVIWKTNILLVILYVLVISSTEYFYLSSVLYKFGEGGYLPFSFAIVLMFIMCTWNYVHRAKYNYELNHKVPREVIKDIVSDTSISKMRGLAIFYSELAHGIPPIFKHYVDNVPALHSVLVFVSIKSLPISRVAPEERFLFRRVKPNELYVFRCVVRYGYTDVRNEKDSFEKILIEHLKEFVETDYRAPEEQNRRVADEDLVVLDKSWRAGVVHLVGEHEIVSKSGSSIGKRFLIDYAYNFMRKNLRQSSSVFEIPHKRMLKVGMTYEL